MVVDREIPREQQTPVQIEEINCVPLSEVRTEGTPNLATLQKDEGSDTGFSSD